MVGLQQALLWSLVPAFGLSCSVCVLTFEPGLCVLLLHAASGGVGGALGPLRLALPADGYRGSAGAHPAGRRLGMYKPRACRGPVDGGGHREQPGHPAGQSWAQGKEPVLPSDVFLCCFCERVGAASALWFIDQFSLCRLSFTESQTDRFPLLIFAHCFLFLALLLWWMRLSVDVKILPLSLCVSSSQPIFLSQFSFIYSSRRPDVLSTETTKLKQEGRQTPRETR